MEELEMICFKIISAVGTARSIYIEAIQEAKKGDFEKAEELMKEGSEAYVQGHRAHSELVQRDARGETVIPTVLLMHAEDQLMNTDGFKIIAEEFIEVYKSRKS